MMKSLSMTSTCSTSRKDLITHCSSRVGVYCRDINTVLQGQRYTLMRVAFDCSESDSIFNQASSVGRLEKYHGH